MKGSTYGREVGSNPITGDILKDLDFRFPCLLSEKMQSLLTENLRQDCDFLCQQKLMDYSLLVGVWYRVEEELGYSDPDPEDPETVQLLKKVHPRQTRKLSTYAFGIIDYLQKWTWQKE